MKLRETIYALVSAGQIDARIVGSGVSATVKCAALENPRTLMGNFEEIESALGELVAELRALQRMWLRPKILVHLLPEFDGGYTDVELRAFREAGASAGCAESWVLVDHAIASDEQLEMLFNGPMGMSLIPTKEELGRS